jgi:hypothetical protein
MEINKRNYPFPMADGRWPMPHPRPTPVKFNFFHLLSVILLGLTATACSGSLPSSGQAGVESPSVTQSKASPTTEVGAPSKPNAQGWVTLYPGEAADGLEFSKDGKLSLKGKVLVAKIGVTYSSDGQVSYAKRLIVSPPSPSGNFNLLRGCDGVTEGLCWKFLLIDRQAGEAKETTVGKYGADDDWMQWSANERYLLMKGYTDGAAWLYAIDLQTAEGRALEFGQHELDLSSFTWVDEGTFQIKVNELHQSKAAADGGNETADAPFWFKGNLAALFADKAINYTCSVRPQDKPCPGSSISKKP